MGKSCLQDIEIPHVLEDLRTDIHLQSRGRSARTCILSALSVQLPCQSQSVIYVCELVFGESRSDDSFTPHLLSIYLSIIYLSIYLCMCVTNICCAHVPKIYVCPEMLPVFRHIDVVNVCQLMLSFICQDR